MKRILATVFVALGLLLGVGLRSAAAKPTIVAITPIDGDANGSIGDAITEALDGSELNTLAPKVVTRAVDKLGYEGELSDKQAKKLATELEADAVVQATLDRDGKRKVLKFKLLVRGKKARGFKVTFNNAKSENFRAQLKDKMVERLSTSHGDGGDADEAKPDDEDPIDGGKKKKKKLKKSEDADTANAGDEDDEETSTKKKKKKKKVAKGDEDEEEPTDEEEEDIEAAVSRVSPHTANRVAVRLDVGVSVQNRKLIFTQRSNFPEGPKPYKNAPVPGARVEGELYPLAFMNPKSLAAGLGFAAEYDKTLSLTLRTTAEANTPVKATQQHWSIGGRLRIPFGRKATSPTVTLGVGYGSRSFKTDRSVLMDQTSLDVPDTSYKIIDPGLAFRIPLAGAVALTFGGKALIITDAGPIQKPESYGRAKVFGGSAQAGVDIVLGNRFAIRLVGEFVQVGFAFTGTGAMANARDRDPMTKDVGGASDRSIGGAMTLGVLY
jgi:hypothetical protein